MPSTTADDDAIAGAKRMLRQAVQLRRESRSAEQRNRDDEARLAVIEAALDPLPGTVAAYLSPGVEPGTLQLVGWLAAHGVRVLLPVLSAGPAPAWAPYAGPDALQLGRHRVLEPARRPAARSARDPRTVEQPAGRGRPRRSLADPGPRPRGQPSGGPAGPWRR